MDNTNAVLADKLGEILAQLDEVVMTDTERAKVLIENYEALRQPTQTDALREALDAAPIISQWEGPGEFRARQDEWLQGKYKAALEAPMVEITQDDKLLNEVVTLRWKCGDQAAEIETLRAALLPFADLATGDVADSKKPEAIFVLMDGKQRYSAVSMKAFRSAKSALKEPTQ